MDLKQAGETTVLRLFPLIILGFAGYFGYGYCYRYSWIQVGGGRGIAFICIFTVLAGLVLFTWALILLIGPGKIEKIPIDGELPLVFMCDPQGYRQWCSNCSSVKPDRAHHAKQKGACVPKMDHYCAWLQAVIGQANFKFFIQFVFYFWLLLLYVVISLLIFAHNPGLSDELGGHRVALYVISGFWLTLLTGFLAVNLRYILGNMTTIEHMDLGRRNYPIYNIECDGERVVTRLYREDVFPKGPYSQGYFINWKQAMGPSALHWLLPIQFKHQESVFNHGLLETARDRYRQRKEGYLAYSHLTTSINPEPVNSGKEAPRSSGDLYQTLNSDINSEKESIQVLNSDKESTNL